VLTENRRIDTRQTSKDGHCALQLQWETCVLLGARLDQAGDLIYRDVQDRSFFGVVRTSFVQEHADAVLSHLHLALKTRAGRTGSDACDQAFKEKRNQGLDAYVGLWGR
jgi:hypothetical protein